MAIDDKTKDNKYEPTESQRKLLKAIEDYAAKNNIPLTYVTIPRNEQLDREVDAYLKLIDDGHKRAANSKLRFVGYQQLPKAA